MRWSILFTVLLLGIAPARAEPLGEPEEGLAAATFAGGCFWCVEEAYDGVEGVVRTISGYTGGHARDPSYRQVVAGGTGHAEAVRVVYDPQKVDYAYLLKVFWYNIDPTVENRQFCDSGSQYRTAIYYHSPEQRKLAEQTRDELEASGVLPGPIVTEIEPVSEFWVAEEYHQNYWRKNPVRYKFYFTACGRGDRLEELWGDKAQFS
ncbi:MAG: peptide-methionine (S)-S-oxide reductase MsrA [Halofilum sp. (in: g-proteobacteria)]|nr:peptide-methionine (S)-S-oxide reductase MsrA [Halofilum sp. (in: g-proteobacteria)]